MKRLFAATYPTPHFIALLFIRLIGIGLISLCLQAHAEEASLYERIGGTPILQKIADQLIDRAQQEASTQRSFDKVNIPHLKEKLTEQLCHVTGGPCQYTGDSMAQVHQGLKITQKEFYALVEQLRNILDANQINEREKNELLNLLAPMKTDVVQK